MAQQPELSKIEFMKRFSSEDACEQKLHEMKWPNGFVCDKCGGLHFYTTTTRRLKLYQCKDCGHQTTVTAGTVLEKTRTDLVKWFLAIFTIANDKRGVSAMLLSKEIEVSYPTAWLILHKIRQAMAQRDCAYMLSGIVEFDDAYIGQPTVGGKRGRGTEKSKILVAVSTNEKGYPQFAKMEVVENIRGTTLVDFANRNIDPNATISSDAYRPYNKLAETYDHKPEVYVPDNDTNHLKWLHIVISNLKAFIDGTYHGLDSKHLQSYLNEFCYRFNRRNFEAQGFFRLLSCCATGSKITYSELT